MNKLLPTLFLLTIALVGCGRPKPDVEVTQRSTSAKTPESVSSSVPSTEQPQTSEPAPKSPQSNKLESTQPALVATAPKGTAEATFQQTLIAFQEGQIDTIFGLLPNSFQSDVEKLVHQFGNKMDAELWSKTFETLQKLAGILRSKKSMILDSDFIKHSPVFDLISPQWDEIVSGIHDVATSEIANVENLKHSDLRGLLSSGSQLLSGMPLPKFGNVTVETVKSTDDSATLSYRESKDGEPRQVEWVKVEGKWMPKSLADGWADSMRDLNARLESLPGRVAAFKPRVIQHLDGFNGILDKVQASKTREEFSLALAELALSIRLAALTVQDYMLEASITPRKGNDVNIEINRDLDEKEQKRLTEAVTSDFGPNVDYELVTSEGKTHFRCTPVTELQSLVGMLKKHFKGADVQLDTEKRTIQVKLKSNT